MIISFQFNNNNYLANLSDPLDISIPLEEGIETVNCFYAPPMETSPVIAGNFIGSTKQGGLVNFLNIKVNPHGNGTHTECVGHIAKEKYTINQCLKKFNHLAKLVSIYPTKTENGDRVIFKSQVKDVFQKEEAEAIIIRTLPNNPDKLKRNYSGTNPPYIHHEAMQHLVACGVKHLLIDLPSVDREEDEGQLLAHKAFWQYPENVRKDCTISELIFVEDVNIDGYYLLNLQIAPFEIDVSPSKPVLYALKKS